MEIMVYGGFFYFPSILRSNLQGFSPLQYVLSKVPTTIAKRINGS